VTTGGRIGVRNQIPSLLPLSTHLRLASSQVTIASLPFVRNSTFWPSYFEPLPTGTSHAVAGRSTLSRRAVGGSVSKKFPLLRWRDCRRTRRRSDPSRRLAGTSPGAPRCGACTHPRYTRAHSSPAKWRSTSVSIAGNASWALRLRPETDIIQIFGSPHFP
jgi:hypothetical protein